MKKSIFLLVLNVVVIVVALIAVTFAIISVWSFSILHLRIFLTLLIAAILLDRLSDLFDA